MPFNPLRHKKELVAIAQNYEDVVELLTEMATAAANINTKIGENDSVEVRKAIHTYLLSTVDELRMIRNNKIQRHSSSSVGDDG